MNKVLILVVLAALLSACKQSDKQILSARYDVCAELGKYTYSALEPGPDYDVGEIMDSGRRVEVLIGGHPGFPTTTLVKGLAAVDGFKVIGNSRDGDLESLLFARATGSPGGPTYVRFSSRDVDGNWGPIRNGFLASCDQEK